MISFMDKVSMFSQMVIVGLVHLRKVKLMAMVAMSLIKTLMKIILLMISCMDMELNSQKFNLNHIIIKVNLELVKNLAMEF